MPQAHTSSKQTNFKSNKRNSASSQLPASLLLRNKSARGSPKASANDKRDQFTCSPASSFQKLERNATNQPSSNKKNNATLTQTQTTAPQAATRANRAMAALDGALARHKQHLNRHKNSNSSSNSNQTSSSSNPPQTSLTINNNNGTLTTLCNNEHRKQNHCEIEKRRRDKMNHYILELASVIPSFSSNQSKFDKLTVLRMAVQQVKSLRSSLCSFSSFHLRPSFLSSGNLLKNLILQMASQEAQDNLFMIVSCDRGKVLFVSQSSKDILNQDQDELVGQCLFDLLHKDDVTKVKEQISYSNLMPKEMLVDSKTLQPIKSKRRQSFSQLQNNNSSSTPQPGARRSFFCRMKSGRSVASSGESFSSSNKLQVPSGGQNMRQQRAANETAQAEVVSKKMRDVVHQSERESKKSANNSSLTKAEGVIKSLEEEVTLSNVLSSTSSASQILPAQATASNNDDEEEEDEEEDEGDVDDVGDDDEEDSSNPNAEGSRSSLSSSDSSSSISGSSGGEAQSSSSSTEQSSADKIVIAVSGEAKAACNDPKQRLKSKQQARRATRANEISPQQQQQQQQCGTELNSTSTSTTTTETASKVAATSTSPSTTSNPSTKSDVSACSARNGATDWGQRQNGLSGKKHKRYIVMHCTGYLKSITLNSNEFDEDDFEDDFEDSDNNASSNDDDDDHDDDDHVANSYNGDEENGNRSRDGSKTINCLVAVCRRSPMDRDLKPDRPLTFTCRYSMEGKFVFVDQRTTVALGYTPQQLLGTSHYAYCHKDSVNTFKECHRQSILKSEPVSSDIYQFKRANGQHLWLQTSLKSFRNPWTKFIDYIVANHTTAEGSEPRYNEGCVPTKFNQDLTGEVASQSSSPASSLSLNSMDSKKSSSSPSSSSIGSSYSMDSYNSGGSIQALLNQIDRVKSGGLKHTLDFHKLKNDRHIVKYSNDGLQTTRKSNEDSGNYSDPQSCSSFSSQNSANSSEYANSSTLRFNASAPNSAANSNNQQFTNMDTNTSIAPVVGLSAAPLNNGVLYDQTQKTSNNFRSSAQNGFDNQGTQQSQQTSNYQQAQAASCQVEPNMETSEHTTQQFIQKQHARKMKNHHQRAHYGAHNYHGYRGGQIKSHTSNESSANWSQSSGYSTSSSAISNQGGSLSSGRSSSSSSSSSSGSSISGNNRPQVNCSIGAGGALSKNIGMNQNSRNVIGGLTSDNRRTFQEGSVSKSMQQHQHHQTATDTYIMEPMQTTQTNQMTLVQSVPMQSNPLDCGQQVNNLAYVPGPQTMSYMNEGANSFVGPNSVSMNHQQIQQLSSDLQSNTMNLNMQQQQQQTQDTGAVHHHGSIPMIWNTSASNDTNQTTDNQISYQDINTIQQQQQQQNTGQQQQQATMCSSGDVTLMHMDVGNSTNHQQQHHQIINTQQQQQPVVVHCQQCSNHKCQATTNNNNQQQQYMIAPNNSDLNSINLTSLAVDGDLDEDQLLEYLAGYDPEAPLYQIQENVFQSYNAGYR